MAAVRGPDFMNVGARRVAVPPLPPYLPQVRLRRGLRGALSDPIYGIRGWEVIGKRQKLLAADAIRAELALTEKQKLVLILFDDDTLLERLWEEADVLIPDLVEARFDLVVSPSYSIYQPRPRLEHLYNLKRAFEIFARCQQLLIPAIPRAVPGSTNSMFGGLRGGLTPTGCSGGSRSTSKRCASRPSGLRSSAVCERSTISPAGGCAIS